MFSQRILVEQDTGFQSLPGEFFGNALLSDVIEVVKNDVFLLTTLHNLVSLAQMLYIQARGATSFQLVYHFINFGEK